MSLKTVAVKAVENSRESNQGLPYGESLAVIQTLILDHLPHTLKTGFSCFFPNSLPSPASYPLLGDDKLKVKNGKWVSTISSMDDSEPQLAPNPPLNANI